MSYNLQSAAELLEQILTTLQPERTEEETDTLILRFLEQIPEIKACLETDIQAAYDGDPAAMSCDEIMLAYPAFEAISIYRMAHRLYKMGIPMLPRMMTEYAHQLTGIDIHPGATIGNYFFIDHGTGVVIGETTTIGEHVKLYQGVTLGAKSFELDEHGNPVKGIKRHPDIGNHVVVYAGATILGGMTHHRRQLRDRRQRVAHALHRGRADRPRRGRARDEDHLICILKRDPLRLRSRLKELRLAAAHAL